MHQSRRQQIVFGARGVAQLDITVYGPSHELHSGHYGNWAPNPAMMLARLLASMKDEDGKILVEHYYEGIEPLTDTEKRAIAEAPDVDGDLRRELALGRTENSGKKLVELLNFPSLNIRGMSSARTGAGASNVIPATATATIDCRLVKGITSRNGDAARDRSHPQAGLFHRRYGAGHADAHGASPRRQSDRCGRRLQRVTDIDGPADFAARAADSGSGPWSDRQAADDGRERAAYT